MSEKISRIMLFDTLKGKEKPKLVDVFSMIEHSLNAAGIGLYVNEDHAKELGSHSEFEKDDVITRKIIITFEFGKMDDEKEHE